MDERQDTTVEALMEHLIEHGPNDMATVFARAFELAMRDCCISLDVSNLCLLVQMIKRRCRTGWR